MRYDLQEKLSKKHMTRREFLQFMAGSFLVLFGLGNIIAFLSQMKTSAEPTEVASTQANHGFGSRKFGA
jgi:hypothetical protein